MNDRLRFRAFYQGIFIYKTLVDANYYTKDGKCIALVNTLPNTVVWEQCTGLKDRNGKLIYENDIVYDKFNDCYELVYWDDEGCWSSQWKPLRRGSSFEIYGNIHENKELIK